MKTYPTIDAYIAAYPPEVRALLEKIRATIAKAAPSAKEAIKYGIPTFVQHGNLVHFGGFAHHIGFYPGSPGVRVTFARDIAQYKGGKGTLKFPLDKPLLLALVTKIVKFRIKEDAALAKMRAMKRSTN